MDANLKNVEAVVHKLFGKTFDEAKKQLFGDNFSRYATEHAYPWGVHQREGQNGSVTISIGFRGYISLIQFTLAYYPSCCGSMLFHAFSVEENKVSQEQLDEVMNVFFRDNEDLLGGSKRIEVMMVENRRAENGYDYAHTEALDDPQPVENPNMRYKSLWNFFHKYAKRVRTRLEVNANTSNVLHNMEVIF